jgi:hypothetical protein
VPCVQHALALNGFINAVHMNHVPYHVQTIHRDGFIYGEDLQLIYEKYIYNCTQYTAHLRSAYYSMNGQVVPFRFTNRKIYWSHICRLSSEPSVHTITGMSLVCLFNSRLRTYLSPRKKRNWRTFRNKFTNVKRICFRKLRVFPETVNHLKSNAQ